MKTYSDLLLRWSFGSQDTTSLSDYEINQFKEMLYLCKLSIISFQKWFPGACCVLLYNGNEFETFIKLIEVIDLHYFEPVEYIDQHEELRVGNFENKYPYWPVGVWWKWVPFRLDISKHEIAIDTDIVCIAKPQSWVDWLDRDEEILIAPERYEKVRVNTTGDFHTHPLLKNKAPFNCGIVGQRSGHDYADRFFDITQEVNFGQTHDSLFITEQGAINLWIRSLEAEGIRHRCLDFTKNAWMRDFIYFLEKGVQVETVHAVAWHKRVAMALGDVFERRIYERDYTNEQFVADIIKQATAFKNFSKSLIGRQIGVEGDLSTEWLLPKESQ